MSHTPVLLHQVIEFLDPQPGDFIIDGTVDGGGHAREIAERISPGGVLLGVDWDEEMIARARSKISAEGGSPSSVAELPRRTGASGGKNKRSKIVLTHGNYADLPEILQEKKLPQADGLLLDLGFSSEQLERSGRGFSFLRDEPLLLTYSDDQLPARELLKKMTRAELAGIIRELGGERLAQRIADAIYERERRQAIGTSGELAAVIRRAVPASYERGRIDPATRTFQALRIYVNRELENLETILGKLNQVLKPAGRVVVISFHSLEDGLVKKCLREQEKQGILKILTKKPIRPSRAEMAINPRSRSARLRAAQLM